MELRPYQKEAKEAIFEQWDSGVLKTLLVLPTGCGKTVVFAKVTEECVRKGDRVLILAHRGELLDQAADKLMKTTGLGCALEKAESSCQGSWFRVVVGSVQTLMREKRLGSFPADYFNTIIIDEAHHCIHCSSRCLFRQKTCPVMFRLLDGRWDRHLTNRSRHWKSWESCRIRLRMQGRQLRFLTVWTSVEMRGLLPRSRSASWRAGDLNMWGPGSLTQPRI